MFKPLTVNTASEDAAHIYAEDDALIYGFAITGDGVLNIGSCMSAEIVNNNKIRISDGALMIGGHVGRIAYADHVDITVENGTAGRNRNDIIYAKFLTSGNADSFTIEIKKGKETAGAAADPALTSGNLYQGENERDLPLYRVKISGLALASIEKMFIPVKTADEKIEDLKKSASDGKKKVAAAITEKKVATASDASFETMAENIKKITLGSGNAQKREVLSGKTFTNDDGVEYTGTMENRGAWTGGTSGEGNTVIPEGYHNGKGYVSGKGSYNSGYNAGYSGGYGEGRNQGRADVTGAPNSYGLYTGSQYNEHYSSGYNAGYSAGGSGKARVKSGTMNYNFRGGWEDVTINTGLNSVDDIVIGGGTGDPVRGITLGNITSRSGGSVTVSMFPSVGMQLPIKWIAYGT